MIEAEGNYFNPLQAILPVIHKPLSVLLFRRAGRRGEEPLSKAATHAEESYACLAYLLFVQLIAMETFPKIFRYRQLTQLVF